jgi:hypothetical protein
MQGTDIIDKTGTGWPTIIQGVHNIEYKKGKS